MGLSDAQRQARYRVKRQAETVRMRAEIDALRIELARARARIDELERSAGDETVRRVRGQRRSRR